MLQYSVVIPSNRVFDHIKPLLLSLKNQVFLPSQIVIVLDHHMSSEEYAAYRDRVMKIFQTVSGVVIAIVHTTIDSQFVVGKGASYVRNYGRKQVTVPYMMYIDDDNTFDEYFAQNIFSKRQVNADGKYKKNYLTTLVVPVQYDDTSTYVRAAVADGFEFALCRPHRLTTELISTVDRYISLTLASSNCLVGPTAIFEQFPFDEEIPFVYEDLIMTGAMRQGGVTIVCDTWATLIHNHGTRGVLASLYINTPLRAYYKAKHRMILVDTIGSPWQKNLFYMIGLRGQTGWLVLHILFYASVREWVGLIGALVRGTRDGLNYKK